MLSKALILGRLKKKELTYKTGSDKVVPVCEIEVLTEEEPQRNLIKITFFYEKAEEVAEKVSVGSLIYVEAKLKGAKDRYYSLDLWGIRYKVITGGSNENTDT